MPYHGVMYVDRKPIHNFLEALIPFLLNAFNFSGVSFHSGTTEGNLCSPSTYLTRHYPTDGVSAGKQSQNDSLEVTLACWLGSSRCSKQQALFTSSLDKGDNILLL